MIAFDTNILVYAHRKDSAFHDTASRCVREAAEAVAPWAIPWPCLHEFLAVVTNAKIFKRPTPSDAAIEQVRQWLTSPSVRLLGEETGYLDILERLVREGRITGAKVHDARVAAIATFHGVSELLTADRDFSRFPSLVVRNPL